MTSPGRRRAVLFDLDGTLLDTAPDMAGALNELRVAEGLPPLPFDTLRPHVSHGSARLVSVGFDLEAGERYERLRLRFLDVYRARLASSTRPFDGMDAVLAAIESAGMHWGVVTNKPGWLTEPLLEELVLVQFLVRVQCPGSILYPVYIHYLFKSASTRSKPVDAAKLLGSSLRAAT